MIHSRKICALIPIKENSERVKEKNFRLFNDKPLFEHIIHVLDKTSAIDEIVINTDSRKIILETPKLSHKVKVHERPNELCGDMVSTNKIFAYDLSKTEADIYIQTHTTNPLLKSETIADALKKFVEIEKKYDSLFTVNKFLSRFYNEEGNAVNHNPDELIRTQDLPPLYEENSCLYVFTKSSFEKRNRRIGEKPYLYETPKLESIDIDDELTFKIAELINKKKLTEDEKSYC
ncbi:MAG: acylneuraminate cytidylyltransferase family protein [Victivallales bacterium]|nr:acylneuraminate cytidylyltransferase family protein [Victivallales bacterium]MCF7889408.1 acylneuraminate cytidylyltransferase family protein [Victivallales bacterium]